MCVCVCVCVTAGLYITVRKILRNVLLSEWRGTKERVEETAENVRNSENAKASEEKMLIDKWTSTMEGKKLWWNKGNCEQKVRWDCCSREKERLPAKSCKLQHTMLPFKRALEEVNNRLFSTAYKKRTFCSVLLERQREQFLAASQSTALHWRHKRSNLLDLWQNVQCSAHSKPQLYLKLPSS